VEPPIDQDITDNEAKQKLRRIISILKVLDYVSFGFLAVGVLFKIQHWPGAFVLMVTALVSVVILAIIKLIYVREKLPETIRSLAIVFIIAGAIVKINHFPYANYLIIPGIGFLLTYYFLGNRSDNT
jgi:hypothetical protein